MNLRGDADNLFIQTWDGKVYKVEEEEIVPLEAINEMLDGLTANSLAYDRLTGDLWFINYDGIIQYTNGNFIVHNPDTSFTLVLLTIPYFAIVRVMYGHPLIKQYIA